MTTPSPLLESAKRPGPPSHQRQPLAGTSPTATPVLSTLPVRLGNAGLQRLVQAKLQVSQPDDPHEQEANRVADAILRMPMEDGDEPLQRQAEAGPMASASSDHLEDGIRALNGRGNPLPLSVRNFMEPRFGVDFRAVRVHADSGAHALARAVNAQAFTVGSHVVFGAGHYAPETSTGKHLLSHELAHVVQQGAAPARPQRRPEEAATPSSNA